MSSLLYLVLILLSLSVQAIEGRHLSDRVKDASRTYNHTNKSVEKPMVDETLVLEKGTQFSSKGEEPCLHEDMNGGLARPKGSDETTPSMDAKETRRRMSSAARALSQATASWRVPKNKAGYKEHPGFNLDYAGPKTHPPSHN